MATLGLLGEQGSSKWRDALTWPCGQQRGRGPVRSLHLWEWARLGQVQEVLDLGWSKGLAELLSDGGGREAGVARPLSWADERVGPGLGRRLRSLVMARPWWTRPVGRGTGAGSREADTDAWCSYQGRRSSLRSGWDWG